jgi:uncharacterized protein (TIGR00106 family)
MAIVEVSIVPIGTGSTSVSRYVASCIEVLESSGLTFELHGMGTIIEGDLQTVLSVITKMHEVPFAQGALRVVTAIKIDDRRDKDTSARNKIRSVMSKTTEK